MEQEKGIAEDQNGLLTFDPTPHDDIQACTQAMGVIEDLDLALLSEDEAAMVRQIRKMALQITHQALYEIFEGGCYAT
jgi:hypothetical protein